jgi:hypothetical protein
MDTESVVGVWASASRNKSRIYDERSGRSVGHGPFRQVSRLANPLFNEVIVPMAAKDRWNSLPPSADSHFAQYVAKPELASLLPVLYPGVFPHLAAYTKPRADLLAILLTGIPAGVVSGFQNYTGAAQADLLRLNLAIPPSANPRVLGLVAGDPAGFPNGRRVFDDVVTIELRAIAGLTIPLVDPSFAPDAAASAVTDGTSNPIEGSFPVFPTSERRQAGIRQLRACPVPSQMSTEENPHTGQGSVMLDIGDDIGALVLAMPAALEGVEIEIRPMDRSVGYSDADHAHHHEGHEGYEGDEGHDHGEGAQPLIHVAVVGRPIGESVFHCAVFPELSEGS